MEDGTASRQALADRIQRQHHRETRRARLWTTIVVLLGVAASITFLVFNQLGKDGDEATDIAAPNNATEDYGFTVTPELVTGTETGTAPTNVDIYEDFLCPSCKIFHDDAGAFLDEQIAAGTISVTYHPIAFLIANSTDEYTQRAANAAVCVGDHAGALAYADMHALLMQNQPEQGGPGLTDDQLIDFGAQAGGGDIRECVEERRFSPWLDAALEAAKAAEITTTPTVRVAGLTVVRSVNGNESIPGPEELAYAIVTVQ